ncbi:hypothetical protein KL907_004013 [Ogataea polymorpha]|nr:hypothetical protein KL907_004013 [Ogataea polymorpha]
MPKFISIPLKKTKPVDWTNPLSTYIGRIYGNASDFEHEIATFNKLRTDLIHCDEDPIGRDLYYRYYGQLEMLELRIAVESLGIEFCWYDAFVPSVSHKQHSLAFEKASVLFNLAGIMSHLAATAEELKVGYEWFQKAAGVYQYIQESFLHAPSDDLSVQSMQALAKLMLAQAQEVFLLRYIETTAEPKQSLLARLAKSTAKLYGSASELIQNVKTMQYNWHQYTKLKELYYLSYANFQQSQLLKSSNKHGQAIAYMKLAEETIKKHSGYSSTFDPTFKDKLKEHAKLVRSEYELLEKDNDFIYHDMVPNASTLPEIKPMDSAKAVVLGDQKISEIVGKDLFDRIVPLKVHEQSSMYSEEVAKLLRAESEKCELADLELNSTLEFLQLPKSLVDLRLLLEETNGNESSEVNSDTIDARVVQGAAAIMNESVDTSRSANLRAQVQSNVDTCDRLVAQEAQKYDSNKAKHGTAWVQEQYPAALVKLKQDLARAKKSLLDASDTDKKISAIYNKIKPDIEILSKGITSAEVLREYNKTAKEPESLLDMDDEPVNVAGSREKLTKVDDKLQKLRYLQKERSNTYEDLKEKAHNDDISKSLIMNRNTTQIEDIFNAELAKFRPYQERIALTVEKQAPLINDLKKAMNEVLDDHTVKFRLKKRESSKSTTQAVNARFLNSIEQWNTYKGGVAEGEAFYERLLTFTSNLRFALEKLVSERSNEADKLVHQIETNGPQRDQDLLRQQFERFSLQNQAPAGHYGQPGSFASSFSSPAGSFSSPSAAAPPLPSKPTTSTDFYSTPSAYDPSLYSQFNRRV